MAARPPVSLASSVRRMNVPLRTRKCCPIRRGQPQPQPVPEQSPSVRITQVSNANREPKAQRGIGKGRNIEGITFTGRAGTLCPKWKGQSAEEVSPRSFYAPPRSPWAWEPRNFPPTIITFNGEVHSALGMKPEPPFKTAGEKFPSEHDAEVTACQALLDTTALPIPKRIPPQPTKGGCCVLPCLYAHK